MTRIVMDEWHDALWYDTTYPKKEGRREGRPRRTFLERLRCAVPHCYSEPVVIAYERGGPSPRCFCRRHRPVAAEEGEGT
jgi:hypothetical protein